MFGCYGADYRTVAPERAPPAYLYFEAGRRVVLLGLKEHHYRAHLHSTVEINHLLVGHVRMLPQDTALPIFSG
jgi:hypothetical protein